MSALRVVVACLAVASSAAAGPPRKKLPDKYTRAAGELFARAAAADAAGDKQRAIALYHQAFEVVPEPSIAFNIAEISMELREYEDAVEHYDLYLALAPTAADRAAIVAAVAKLEAMPGTIIVVPGNEQNRKPPIRIVDAYVLIDGAIVKRPGAGGQMSVRVKPGRHTVDVITSLTMFSDTVDIGIGGRAIVEAAAPPRIDGNTVISLARPTALRVFASGAITETTRRVLDPGRRRFAVQDGSRECAPITVDIPRGPDRVAYVHFAGEEAFAPQCGPLAISSHQLVFPP